MYKLGMTRRHQEMTGKSQCADGCSLSCDPTEPTNGELERQRSQQVAFNFEESRGFHWCSSFFLPDSEKRTLQMGELRTVWNAAWRWHWSGPRLTNKRPPKMFRILNGRSTNHSYWFGIISRLRSIQCFFTGHATVTNCTLVPSAKS